MGVQSGLGLRRIHLRVTPSQVPIFPPLGVCSCGVPARLPDPIFFVRPPPRPRGIFSQRSPPSRPASPSTPPAMPPLSIFLCGPSRPPPRSAANPASSAGAPPETPSESTAGPAGPPPLPPPSRSASASIFVCLSTDRSGSQSLFSEIPTTGISETNTRTARIPGSAPVPPLSARRPTPRPGGPSAWPEPETVPSHPPPSYRIRCTFHFPPLSYHYDRRC